MSTLVVIDMQKGFLDDMLYPEADGTVPDGIKHNRLIRNVHDMIKLWDRDCDPVVFVEYKTAARRHSKTLSKLTRGGDGNHYTVLKTDNDGSAEVHSVIESQGLSKELVVCGINTDACVMETIEGLLKLNPQYDVSLVEECTTNVYDYNTFDQSMEIWKRSTVNNITRAKMDDYNLHGMTIPSEPIYTSYKAKALVAV